MTQAIRWLLPSAVVLGASVLLLGSSLGWRGLAPFASAFAVAIAAVSLTARWGPGVAFGLALALAFVLFLVAFAAGTGALSFA